jgi:hypothetical protein
MISWRLPSHLIIGVAIIALQACHNQNKLGAATPERVVESYLLALEAKDERSIAKLQTEDTVNEETTAIITRLGGRKLQDIRVKYIKTTPTLWHVKIVGNYLDRNNIPQKFEDNIAIVYQSKESWKLYSGRWFLEL